MIHSSVFSICIMYSLNGAVCQIMIATSKATSHQTISNHGTLNNMSSLFRGCLPMRCPAIFSLVKIGLNRRYGYRISWLIPI